MLQDPELSPNLPAGRRLWILYAFLLVTVGLYWAGAEFLPRGIPAPAPPIPAAVVVVLGVAGGAQAVVAMVLRFLLIPRSLQSTDPNSADKLRRRMGLHIVCYALLDAAAIYGLLLALLGKPWSVTLPFFAGPALLMLVCRPELEARS